LVKYLILVFAVGACLYNLLTAITIDATTHQDNIIESIAQNNSSDRTYSYTYPWVLAILGSPRAQIRMSEHDFRFPLSHDDAETLYWLRKAAHSGSLAAQRYLYRKLIDLSEQRRTSVAFSTLPEAIMWAQVAADQNDPVAEADMGCIYADAIGVPSDFLLAGRWFKRADDHIKKGDFISSICGVVIKK
jgi:TPR repeat protein